MVMFFGRCPVSVGMWVHAMLSILAPGRVLCAAGDTSYLALATTLRRCSDPLPRAGTDLGTRLCTCWTVCSAGNMRIAGHSECVAVASRTGPVFPDRGYRLTLLSLSSRGSAWEMSDFRFCLTTLYRVCAKLGVATAGVSLCRDP